MWSFDQRARTGQEVRIEAGSSRPRSRGAFRRAPSRHGAQWVGEVDASRSDGWPARADRRGPRGRPSAWAHRLSRPRAARLQGAVGARKPRSLRPALSRPRAARDDRRAARALRPVGGAASASGLVFTRDAAAARSLPSSPARPRASPPGRALLGPRRLGADARRRSPGRSGGFQDPGRREPRTRTHPTARHPGPGTSMNYFADVAALARKDLLLELRSRDTLPAMLLFVVSALVVFHFSLPSDASAEASTGLLWIALLFTALLGLGRAFTAEREQRVL